MSAVATARTRVDDVSLDAAAWALALALFGLGDLATTSLGFQAGFVEANPLFHIVLDDVTLGALAVAKALGFVVAWVVWKRTDSATWVVPGTLAFSGALIVGWNTGVLLSV